jgi:hypothetical protein
MALGYPIKRTNQTNQRAYQPPVPTRNFIPACRRPAKSRPKTGSFSARILAKRTRAFISYSEKRTRQNDRLTIILLRIHWAPIGQMWSDTEYSEEPTVCQIATTSHSSNQAISRPKICQADGSKRRFAANRPHHQFLAIGANFEPIMGSVSKLLFVCF